jgi:hypothetical protein
MCRRVVGLGAVGGVGFDCLVLRWHMQWYAADGTCSLVSFWLHMWHAVLRSHTARVHVGVTSHTLGRLQATLTGACVHV